MKWANFCVGALLIGAIVHWPDVIDVGTAQKTLHVVSNADITDPYDVITMAVKMHERTDAAHRVKQSAVYRHWPPAATRRRMRYCGSVDYLALHI